MANIIIDVEYFGSALEVARISGQVSTKQMSHLLDCNSRQLHRYERGVDLIPRNVLIRIFKYAAMMDEQLNNKQS